VNAIVALEISFASMSHASHTPATPLFWPMDWALPAGVQAICTTRVGGVSQEPFDGFNLGDHVKDDVHAVTQNRALLQAQLGGARPVFLSQVHGVEVAQLNAATLDGTKADACLTQDSQVACTITVADCLPLLLTDDAGQVVAAAHAGWRGLAAGVVEQTVHAMREQAGVSPAQMRVWLGPCIGSDAFEVGEDVRVAFTAQGNAPDAACYFKPHPTHAGKWLADLAGLTRWRLQALGVSLVAGNDSTSEWCTVHQGSRLFSYRRDGVTGRFAVCIWRN
jgi:polyphenol oxidase